MSKLGHVFFISGVTGAGKGTLIKALLDKKIADLEFAKSVKTRPLRPGEVDGVDYIKLSVEEFQEAIEKNEFLEYNFVHNQNYYGTRKKDVIDNGINAGKYILKEIDMLILPELLETIKSHRDNFTFIFLNLEENEIRNRMLARGDKVDNKDYKFRVESAIKEKQLAYLCDFVIDAHKPKEEVLDEVVGIIHETIQHNK